MKNLKTHLSSFKNNYNSKDVFLLITTVSGYAFAYFYLLVMGRLLGPETYGILGALFAIFYVACLIGQALREAIATKIAEIKAKDGEAAAINAFVSLALKLSSICLLFSLAFIATARPIASFFHLTTVTPVVILGFSIFTALVLDIVLGIQQGLQQFKYMGITGYSTSQGLKLVFGFTFVLIGWELNGAVGALLASTAVATFVGLVLSRKKLLVKGDILRRQDSRIIPIILPTLILALFLSVPASVDVMLVTHFFGGKEAGLYHAVATVGKVVVFLPMAVSFILLPRATESHTQGKDTKSILLQSLLITAFLSCGVALVCWIFPDIVIKVFFGQAYIKAVSILGLYVTAMLLFSLNVVTIHYSLAIRNLRLMLFADLITLAQVGAIILIHQSLEGIIIIMLSGNLLILLCSLPYLIFRRPAND